MGLTRSGHPRWSPGPQTLMIRDWWTCTIVSVMFEFLEYSLEHQLPNFSECWWDHVGAGHAHRGGSHAHWVGVVSAHPPPLPSPTLSLGRGTWVQGPLR